MDSISAHHLNAFNVQISETESVMSSNHSNMSGTFNKINNNNLNNSLKINQRKQVKNSSQSLSHQSLVSSQQQQQLQSEREFLMSDNESLNSFKQDKNPPAYSKGQISKKIPPPPPPMLVQSLGKGSQQQQQISKNMPPPMVNKTITPPPPMLSIQEKAKQVLLPIDKKPSQTNNNNNGSIGPSIKVYQDTKNINNNNNTTGGFISPVNKVTKDSDNYLKENSNLTTTTAIIKEESQDFSKQSNSFLKKNEQEVSISQDMNPLQDEDDPYTIKINIKNHSYIPTNIKLPNSNYNILEQAKFLILTELTNKEKQDSDFQINEDILSRTIKQIHNHLLKQKEAEFEKSLGDYKQQVFSLQAQISLLTNNQAKQQVNPYLKKGTFLGDTPAAVALNNNQSQNLLNESNQQDIQSAEEIKKLKEENQELRMKSMFLEQDLQFQAQKTKDLSLKYENEIENLRSQLKGSQSEQFVRQQIEHKKLIEDNSLLMREVKILQDQLREEQQRVIDLFEDAQAVREEILKEMSEYEKTKGELEKMKALNKNLRKRLNDQSLDLSEIDDGSQEDYEYNDNDQNNNTLGADASVNKPRKKKKAQQVSVGISRPESLLSLANGFNQRLEELIEEKSKSIVNVITKTQINQFNTHYQHPYALNYLGQNQQAYQNNYGAYHEMMQNPNNNQIQPKKLDGKVVEMSLYESERGINHQDSSQHLENHESPDSTTHHEKILQSNSSELQILKHKIREIRDKHNKQIQDQSHQSLLSPSQKVDNSISQKIISNQDQNSLSPAITAVNNRNSRNNNHNLMSSLNQLSANKSQADTFKAMNSGIIRQESQPLNNYYRHQNYPSQDDLDPKQKLQQYGKKDSINQDKNYQNQFKTPVWTNQFNLGEDDESEEEEDGLKKKSVRISTYDQPIVEENLFKRQSKNQQQQVYSP